MVICDDENTETKDLVDDKHLKQEEILSDFEEEAMQENKDKKMKKRARQRIRAQVI